MKSNSKKDLGSGWMLIYRVFYIIDRQYLVIKRLQFYLLTFNYN